MPTPFLGEIRMFAGSFCPSGWAYCDGQLLEISQYETLYQLIGNTYGGDGQENFALPNLQARIPINQGAGYLLPPYTLGEQTGVETVVLSEQQLPVHTHPLAASTNIGGSANPANQVLATGQNVQLFRLTAPTAAMSSNVIASEGGSQEHENMMPYLAITYIIAMNGVFPKR